MTTRCLLASGGAKSPFGFFQFRNNLSVLVSVLRCHNVIPAMNVSDLDDSRDDSSVNTEHSAASRRNTSSIGNLPSMQSPASNASCDSAPKVVAIDYENLHVSSEIAELFKLIDDYEPVDIELETPLKIFLPRYIPSVGEVDPMIKIPRPDGVPDGVGTAILDEPIAANQSNAAVIELQLRNVAKNKSGRAVAVRSISNAVKNRDEIDEWVRSVEEIHSVKQPPPNDARRYRSNMGEANYRAKSKIEDEIKSGTVHIPSVDIDLSVEEYARMLCSLFGIPVHDGCVVESVHVLLGLFVELQKLRSHDAMI
jgi:intraflagellar transport protein 46